MSDSRGTQSTTMGDMFIKKRADKQRQGGGTIASGNASKTADHKSNDNRNFGKQTNDTNIDKQNNKSLLQIQSEQAGERKQTNSVNTQNRNSGNGRGGKGGSGSTAKNQSSNSGTGRFDRSSNDNDSHTHRGWGPYRNTSNNNNQSSDRNRSNWNNNSPHDQDQTSDRLQQRGRGARGRGSGGRGSGKNDGMKSGAPKEQGVICTLRDGFGFIHCADRPEQVFFHFSELKDGLKPGDLRVDDEVEFYISEPKPGTSSNSESDKKMSALHVTRLPTSTKIVWEYPDESFTYPVYGIVERSARNADSGNSGRGQGASSSIEGTIRVVSDVIEAVGSESTEVTKAVTVRYLCDEYDPLRKFSKLDIGVSNMAVPKNSTSSATSRAPMYLSRGDLVEMAQIVIDRRTGERYAKRIAIVMSDRQRQYHAQEAKLLATATEEEGVITAIKGDYGFLKSNQRHEEVYFHVSNIHTTDGQSDSTNRKPSMTFKEGQEMKFLVVTEDEDNDEEALGKSRRRVSARQIQVQPAGSVRWHDVLAKGVTGEVIECPQPIDSGHPLETQGKIRLHVPIRISKKHSLEESLKMEEAKHSGNSKDAYDDDEFILCTEVYIWSKDSPGGNFSYRGGTSVGLFIQNGDTLLFDVIRDYIGDGGTCRAARTRYLTPREEEQEESHLEPDDDEDQQGNDSSKAVRLIDLALAGRSEGFISALKEDAYGFLHFAERPVDVHFKMYQLLPEALQVDLRRNMGLPEVVPLEVGAEVHFDLSVHGTIVAKHNNPGNNSKKRQQQHSNVHERENLKAQRILLLPAGTIKQNFPLAKGIKGKISKQDIMQPYVGSIELDNPIQWMLPEQRHPLVARMIESLLSNPRETRIVYHDIQSLKEDEVVVEMTELMGKGMLKCSHIPVAGETIYPGLLCIEKIATDQVHVSHTPDTIMTTTKDVTTSGDDVSEEDCLSNDGISGDEMDADRADKRRKKKKSSSIKVKTLTNVRFDKSSLSMELRNDMPPTINDIVTFDVFQQRRTGQLFVENMSLFERHVPDVTNTGVEAFGVIKDIMPNLNFGFISVLDKSAHASELLAFNLSDVNKSSGGRNLGKLKKGDNVKFIIGSDVKNGKHVALNVELHDPKMKSKTSVPNSNSCKGLVLLKLTKNIFIKGTQDDTLSLKKKNESTTTTLTTPTSTTTVKNALPEKKSRWENVSVTKDEERNRDGNTTEVGFILLTEDPNGVFDLKVESAERNNHDVSSEIIGSCVPPTFSADESEDRAKETMAMENEARKNVSAIMTHLHFKRSNVAIQNGHDESVFPQRGDLVSFNKIRGNQGARDVRIIERGTANLIRGTLQGIDLRASHAKFVVTDSDTKTFYEVSLKEVLACKPSLLKENDQCEGILYGSRVYGICRMSDLYVENSLKGTSGSSKGNGASSGERPKLNLTVKKDRGGTIMAQSMMAKGPDGKTKGFYPGWTTRLSAFAPEFTLPGSN